MARHRFLQKKIAVLGPGKEFDLPAAVALAVEVEVLAARVAAVISVVVIVVVAEAIAGPAGTAGADLGVLLEVEIVVGGLCRNLWLTWLTGLLLAAGLAGSQ